VSRTALFVALLLAAVGCRSAAMRLPLAADDPRPPALIRAWQERASERRAMRGSARLAVDGETLHVRARQILVVERPSRLRVEVQGLLSQTLAVLVTDGPRYQLFRAEDRSFESGEVHPGLLWQVASLDLTPEEAIELVLGAPRLDAALVPLRAFETGDGEIGASSRMAAARRRASRAGAAAQVDAWRGEPATCRPLRRIPAVSAYFAHAIRVEAPNRPRAELRLSGVELNPALPADIFRLRPVPSGGRVDGGGG
jgi:hypothetical protein